MKLTEAKEWWKESVVYQIYPRSFQDSNGDGIGDIRGIIERLPYLADLGINVVWLCPVYKSPMDDGGYDISDYYQIDPMFGTMDDMDELIEKAGELGIKILMDLVVNHTSDEHEWFQKALANPKSKYRDYYIFREGINGNPPNNWRSYFGGSAWEPVPSESNMFYLHAFSKKQPDLNWENIAVRNECIQMINWWLEKGLGGFRIDAILNLKKRIEYGVFPANGEDGLVFIGHWILNQPGIEEWLNEIDELTFKKHNAFTVAEADVPEERLSEYIGENGHFRMVFDFSYTDIDTPETGEWFKQSKWTVKELKDKIMINELITQRNGWGAKYLENHDQPRSINKYLPQEYQDDRSKKMLAVLFMMLHGTPFIYQGQEIGMSNIRMDSITDYNDIATHDQYRRALLSGMSPDEALEWMYRRSRDNSRTPMQWTNQKNAGFSNADEIWLKTNPNYHEINVEQEQMDETSVLNFYKKLIYLRSDFSKYKEVTIYGELVPVESSDTVIAYKRIIDDKELLIVVNFSDAEDQLFTEGCYEQIIANVELPKIVENKFILPAYTGAVFSKILEVE
ncbi:alpha-glucosidase [Listeria welshimeri]|uniref:Oligo-1,6-glucosidase n=1 Tax=Listeria welshimeri serovar 6b (strain ATCC 35897 / DSM 20650 / CCUG 15529 / CIP 8149 / NCTC 11857 / SLCC 5334 / V8) TaxID=386043 RepID=A0AF61_LISW6|nr:alpha-glucosidase [Listeria welshimeri]CAK19643.1 oligo-1,6-glucosidase [Listeria welshimeri serovar 6b str. SLCC5334]SNV17695.1 Oligo-1,6-glucosidase [Listeria welshimeri]